MFCVLVYVLKKKSGNTPSLAFFQKKIPSFFLRGAKNTRAGGNFFFRYTQQEGWLVVAPFSPSSPSSSSSSSSSLDGMKIDGKRR